MKSIELLILAGVGLFWVNRLSGSGSKTSSIIPPTNNPQNKPDQIIKTSFPGYEINKDVIKITNKNQAYDYAYEQGSLAKNSDLALNVMVEKLFGLKSANKISRPYNTSIINKIINIYKSNSDFIYKLWLNYCAGTIDNAGFDRKLIIQFLDILYRYNIKIDKPVQLDLDKIAKQDIIVFGQPYYLSSEQKEILNYVLFPGYFIQDEILSINSGKTASEYAYSIGKNEAEGKFFTYIFGSDYVEYIDSYKDKNYSNSTSLIVKTKEQQEAIWLLLSYVFAGAYSVNKNKAGKYADIINKFAVFVDNNLGGNIPIIKSIEEANLFFSDIVMKMG